MRCGIVVNVTGPPPTIDRRYHDAVIVGLDNVVDKATRVHAAAWTKFLDDYLTRRPQRTGEDHCPLTHDDYRRFLAGKPDGVADFLAARGIRLPPGSPTDLTDDTVYGLQNLERQTFLQLLNTGVPEGKSIASFARRLQVAGVRVAAHTSHRNYGHTLDATGLAEVFAVFVDGAVTAELGLPAEPNPAGLIETAKRLGANPGRCVVIDSCQTGLRAGRNGGFALVIAVDAHGDAENLLSSGADAVVADLAAVTVGSGDAAISTIPDALQVYSQLKRLLTGRRPAVFLDFDGTLSDIVERPEAATLVDGAAEALRALAAQCPVAVISGRDLADVRNRVKVDGLWLAGSHGFELVAPDGSHHQNAAATAAIDGLAEAAAQLADALREIAGAVVEHKRFAVAVHYRNVADDSVDNLIAAVRRLGHAAGLRVTTGRKVVELRPDIAWDKGKALVGSVSGSARPKSAPTYGCRSTSATTLPTKMPLMPCVSPVSGLWCATTNTVIDGLPLPFVSNVLTPFANSSPSWLAICRRQCSTTIRGLWSSTATTPARSGCVKRCARWATATWVRGAAHPNQRKARHITRAPMWPGCTTSSLTTSKGAPLTTKAWSTSPTGCR